MITTILLGRTKTKGPSKSVQQKKFICSGLATDSLVPQEHRRHQKAARDSRVVMYRKYRVGELPDIQIKHSELIRPFQALAQVSYQ